MMVIESGAGSTQQRWFGKPGGHSSSSSDVVSGAIGAVSSFWEPGFTDGFFLVNKSHRLGNWSLLTTFWSDELLQEERASSRLRILLLPTVWRISPSAAQKSWSWFAPADNSEGSVQSSKMLELSSFSSSSVSKASWYVGEPEPGYKSVLVDNPVKSSMSVKSESELSRNKFASSTSPSPSPSKESVTVEQILIEEIKVRNKNIRNRMTLSSRTLEWEERFRERKPNELTWTFNDEWQRRWEACVVRHNGTKIKCHSRYCGVEDQLTFFLVLDRSSISMRLAS